MLPGSSPEYCAASRPASPSGKRASTEDLASSATSGTAVPRASLASRWPKGASGPSGSSSTPRSSRTCHRSKGPKVRKARIEHAASPACPSHQGQQDNGRRAITRGISIPERRMILTRRHPDRPVEPDDLAVEHLVLDDVLDEIGVLLEPAEPLRERYLFAQRVAGAFGQAGHHRGVEDARCDGHDADTALRTFEGDGEGQRDDPAFGRGGGYLDVESGHAGCVDDDAALSAH